MSIDDENSKNTWNLIIERYADFATSVNGGFLTPMLHLVISLSLSPKALKLFPHTSHETLVATKDPKWKLDAPCVAVALHYHMGHFEITLEDKEKSFEKTMLCTTVDEAAAIFDEFAEMLISEQGMS